MPDVRLPIAPLPLPAQRYSCHGCGNCCRDFTVQLRPADLEKLRGQDWERILGHPVTIDFRGVTYLRQRDDGGCVFLQDDGLCRIHAEHGLEAKPLACQLFPFSANPGATTVRMGLSFACQSVQENRGAGLRTHVDEVQRLAADLPEAEPSGREPMLTDHLRAEGDETTTIVRAIDRWLCGDTHDLATRLHGLAWIVSSLAAARIAAVRGPRLAELMDLLTTAAPEELDLLDDAPPTRTQRRTLRQAVFARTEDPKLSVIARQGRWKTVLGQLRRSRRFSRGRGTAPLVGEGWPEAIDLARVEVIAPAADPADVEAIDDLLTRYARATILGGRAWGAGYYGWTVIAGLQALVLNLAAIGWLARLHAAGHDRPALTIEDVRAAVGRVDRTAGRAKWLGSGAERLRLSYLLPGDGLRRLVRAYGPTISIT